MANFQRESDYVQGSMFEPSIDELNSQPHRTLKHSFNVPVLEITPRSQQTKRAYPRTFLKAIKKVKDIREIQNNSILNVKRLRAYDDALSMLHKIQSLSSHPNLNSKLFLFQLFCCFKI